MRLIDADSLEAHEQIEPLGNGMYEYVQVVYKDDIEDAPTIEPAHGTGYRDGYKRGKRVGYKKGMAMRSRITVDVIKDFHDYQVGWLTSHNDITLSPEEENLILNFLHDTADCYVLEVGALK